MGDGSAGCEVACRAIHRRQRPDSELGGKLREQRVHDMARLLFLADGLCLRALGDTFLLLFKFWGSKFKKNLPPGGPRPLRDGAPSAVAAGPGGVSGGGWVGEEQHEHLLRHEPTRRRRPTRPSTQCERLAYSGTVDAGRFFPPDVFAARPRWIRRPLLDSGARLADWRGRRPLLFLLRHVSHRHRDRLHAPLPRWP